MRRRQNECTPECVSYAPPIDPPPHAERDGDCNLERPPARAERRKPRPLLLNDTKCALRFPTLDVILHDSLLEIDVAISVCIRERDRWVDGQGTGGLERLHGHLVEHLLEPALKKAAAWLLSRMSVVATFSAREERELPARRTTRIHTRSEGESYCGFMLAIVREGEEERRRPNKL